jgi:hypothetical protein
MKHKILPYVIALSALAVSGSAAFYSVFGLSQLFAGASTQVLIMGASLEFAKLVTASALYQYWSKLSKVIKAYLTIAVVILMVITSGGIYGFLSAAYQETASRSELLDSETAVIEQRLIRYQDQNTGLQTEKQQLNSAITGFRSSLSNPGQVQYIDKTTGQLITTTSSSTRRSTEMQLSQAISERDVLDQKLVAIQDSITNLDRSLIERKITISEQSELGPLKYLSELTGKPMNYVVNWFLMLIIFVFDPLAIALVIAANVAFESNRQKVTKIDITPTIKK